MEPIIKIEMDDGFKDAFNAVRSEHESIIKRINEIERKLVFENDDKITKLHEDLKVKAQEEFNNHLKYKCWNDDYQSTICEGRYFGLLYAIEAMEELYPWLKKDEEDD
jgi:hypothetical protein